MKFEFEVFAWSDGEFLTEICYGGYGSIGMHFGRSPFRSTKSIDFVLLYGSKLLLLALIGGEPSEGSMWSPGWQNKWA